MLWRMIINTSSLKSTIKWVIWRISFFRLAANVLQLRIRSKKNQSLPQLLFDVYGADLSNELNIVDGRKRRLPEVVKLVLSFLDTIQCALMKCYEMQCTFELFLISKFIVVVQQKLTIQTTLHIRAEASLQHGGHSSATSCRLRFCQLSTQHSKPQRPLVPRFHGV